MRQDGRCLRQPCLAKESLLIVDSLRVFSATEPKLRGNLNFPHLFCSVSVDCGDLPCLCFGERRYSALGCV